jgi:hypothetical protein
MEKKKFRGWLETHCESSCRRYKNDIACRANRVEDELKKVDPGFSLDEEYRFDGGQKVLRRLGRLGRALQGSGVNLPIGSSQMCAIRGSVSWYMKYKKDTDIV